MVYILSQVYFTQPDALRFIYAVVFFRSSVSSYLFIVDTVLLYGYTTMCLALHKLMDIWVFGIWWLLIKLL